MSQRSLSRDAASRAEARRRARLAARGQPEDEDAEAIEAEAPAAPSHGSFLTRIFPAAPPLPGRPEPLADFGYTGPLRPIVAVFYLLGRAPLAWVPFGLLWALGYVAAYAGAATVLGLASQLVQFGALIAAGWFGWRRPWLYGAAAGLLGFVVLFGYILVVSLGTTSSPTDPSAAQSAAAAAVSGFYATIFGAVGGWYGGYLRRRQTQVSTTASRARRRR
ncbi:MAG: hypothetical protein ABJB65_02395 [Chloroflexota bacterium]